MAANANPVCSGRPTTIQSVLQDVESARVLIVAYLGTQREGVESDILAVSGILLVVAQNILVLEQTHENPLFAKHPELRQPELHWERLKQDLLSNVQRLNTAINDEVQRRSEQNQAPSCSRPGTALNQAAALNCPFCSLPIPAAIDARVSDSTGNPTSTGSSIKVRIILQGQEASSPIVCPRCQRKAKTTLLIGADSQMSNSLSVRVALENQTECDVATERLVNDSSQILINALSKFTDIVQGMGHMDCEEIQVHTLVQKSIETAAELLLEIGEGKYQMASWMAPGPSGFSLFQEVSTFLEEHVLLLLPPNDSCNSSN